MRTEKHIIKNRYSNHAIHRDIPVYEMTTDRCSASPMEGYKGTEVTLVDQPAWNEKFSAWQVTGANVTGNNLILNNDVTAKAVYETAKNLTLQTDGHGQIASNRMSGFIGDQATLSNTASTDYIFSAYTITGATLTGSKFNFIGNDVTAKAWFEPAHINYALGEGLYVVDFHTAWNQFDHPEWINGIVNFNSSGTARTNDRYIALKYDLILGSQSVAGSIQYNLGTQINVNSNYSSHDIVINDVSAARYGVNYPGVFTQVSAQRYLSAVSTTGAFAQRMDLSTTLYRANSTQNILQYTGMVTPTVNGWAEDDTGVRWSQREPATHKIILDTQSNRISAFVANEQRIVVAPYNIPQVTGFTAINSIKIQNYENSHGGIKNMKLASFNNLPDAFSW